MTPIAKGLLYSLAYFSIFTAIVAGLREPLAASNVPNHFLPVIITCGMMIPVFLIMTLLLTVFYPEKRFAFEKKARRWTRFMVYMGLFVLLAVILPFFPANAGSNSAWLAGLVPLLLILVMVQPINPPVKLAAIPKSRDSRWRHLKYSGIYCLWTLIPAIAVVVYALNMDQAQLTTEKLAWPVYVGNGLIYGLHLFLLHRIIVVKPHSRFDHMPTLARYKRLAAYFATYVALELAGPWIIRLYWQWNFDFDFSWTLAIVLFFSAAYGTDGSPFKGLTIFSGPSQATKEGMNSAIKRRLDTLAQESRT